MATVWSLKWGRCGIHVSRPEQGNQYEVNRINTLKTVRLNPTPAGKDRTRYGGASAAQLGGEWADIQNVGSQAVDLTGVSLHHIAYHPNGTSHWEHVMTFNGALSPGKVMRIHAGSGPASVLRQEDLAGADHHLFSHGNYVWNNDKADCAGLFDGRSDPFDKACYGANPPEGAILQRVADSLVPAATAAFAASRR
ncbi:MAG: lamin tail domain-containing protein [Planctomycetes bacterium]|nr:lamin tail domain-containing protein [Planctomycetota bacterium]